MTTRAMIFLAGLAAGLAGLTASGGKIEAAAPAVRADREDVRWYKGQHQDYPAFWVFRGGQPVRVVPRAFYEDYGSTRNYLWSCPYCRCVILTYREQKKTYVNLKKYGGLEKEEVLLNLHRCENCGRHTVN